MHKPICDMASLLHFTSTRLDSIQFSWVELSSVEFGSLRASLFLWLRSRAGSGNCPATMATKWQRPKEWPPTVSGMSMGVTEREIVWMWRGLENCPLFSHICRAHGKGPPNGDKEVRVYLFFFVSFLGSPLNLTQSVLEVLRFKVSRKESA